MLKSRSYAGLALMALIGLSACAKQMAPPGGPRDTTPPQIDSTTPPSGSIEIPRDASLSIAFSEPMQREDVERALSIFPAPEHPPDLRWKGTSLVITPDTAWDPQQTYVVTLQSDARDRRGNLIKQSVQIAFSTGATIDSGVIRGTILSTGRPQQGAMALCYRLDGADPNPENDTADYVVQTDSAGQFTFAFLSPGTYRIFGLDDRDRDWLWYIGSEPIGIPSTDLQVTGPDTVMLPPLSLTPLDTITPRISDCRAISPTCIQVSFDTPLDSGRLDEIRITSPATGVNPPALYGLDSLITAIYAVFDHALDTGALELIVTTGAQPDSANAYDTCITRIPNTWDTLFQPLRIIVPDTASILTFAADSILLRLRLPVTGLSADSLLWTNGQGVSLAAPVHRAHPFAVVARVPESLRMTGPLDLTIPQGLLNAETGRSWPSDTTRNLHFRFPHLDSSGDFEIRVAGLAELPSHHRLGIRPGASAPPAAWLALDSSASVAGYMVPGAYYLELHYDRDTNGRRDPGWPYPIRFSEPIWRFHDSLAVRARFTTELSLDMSARK